MLRHILLIVTSFTQWYFYLGVPRLTWVVSSRGKSVLIFINFMHDDAPMARCDEGSWQKNHKVICTLDTKRYTSTSLLTDRENRKKSYLTLGRNVTPVDKKITLSFVCPFFSIAKLLEAKAGIITNKLIISEMTNVSSGSKSEQETRTWNHRFCSKFHSHSAGVPI